MPVPTTIQQSAALRETGNNTSEIVETWNVSPDSTLIAVVNHISSSARTHSVRDSVAGDWIEIESEDSGGARRQSLHQLADHPGGSNVDIIVESNAGVEKYVWVWEISKATLAASDSLGNPNNVNTYPHSAVGINTGADVFSIAALVQNSSTGAYTQTPGWGLVYELFSIMHCQSIESAAPLVDEQAIVTSTGSFRRYNGVIGAWADAASPPTNLIVQDAQHGQTSELVALAVETPIAAASSRHPQSSELVDLVQASVLAVADARHVHTSDQVELATQIALAVLDSEHYQTSDAVDLSQAGTLQPGDARHAQRSVEVPLTTGITLAVAAVRHAHGSDQVAITAETPLLIDAVRHVQRSDNLDLVAAAVLDVLDAVHTHRSTQVIILDDAVGVAEREGTLVYIESEPLVVIEIEPIVTIQ